MSLDKIREEAEEKLDAALARVCDEVTFCEFLRALAEDWFREQEIEKETPGGAYGSGALGWENGTPGAFLDAASRWCEDSRANPSRPDASGRDAAGSPCADNETGIWRRAAIILLMGKIYE